jgi:hypothetical protein
MNKITLILCAEDCSSVQTYAIRTNKPLAEIQAFGGMKLGLPEGFRLIAAVAGWPELKVRDDARTAEWGVE